MACAVESVVPGWICADCSWNVVQRNAPGAMSAMALTVMPVSVSVRFISPDEAVGAAAIPEPFESSPRGSAVSRSVPNGAVLGPTGT